MLVTGLALLASLLPQNPPAQGSRQGRGNSTRGVDAAAWDQPPLVAWQRSIEDAQAISKATGRHLLVCVNLDSSMDEASALLKRTQAPGVHLHTPGGLDSKLATDYGVMVLPNLFLIGKDGNVVSRTVQVGGLEAEIQKILK